MNDRNNFFNCSNSHTCHTDENGSMMPPEQMGMRISSGTTTYTMPDADRNRMMQNNGRETVPAQADPNETVQNQQSETITTPPQSDFDTPAFQGSMQQILSENLGQFVVIEFLIGTQAMTEKMGILYSVGRGFVVLYEELQNRYVVCDIFSIKFVTFYEPGIRPRGSYNNANQANGVMRNSNKKLI